MHYSHLHHKVCILCLCSDISTEDVLAIPVQNCHRQTQLCHGIKMLENFNREEALLTGNMSVNISSDIIEFIFWYLQKQEVTEQTVRCNVFCLDDTAFKSRERIRYKKQLISKSTL